jgi:hypothetical protein
MLHLPFFMLQRIPSKSLDIESEVFQNLERLTVVLYDNTSPLCRVNESRKDLLARGRSIARITGAQRGCEYQLALRYEKI